MTKRKVELIDARNQADTTIYQVEKELKEHGDKLGDADKKAVQSAIERTRRSHEGRRCGCHQDRHARPAPGGPGPDTVCRGSRPGRWRCIRALVLRATGPPVPARARTT